MLTVNLEKELIRQNKKIHTPAELLQIKEYDKIGEDSISNLSGIFPNMSAAKGKRISKLKKETESEISKFGIEKVFHISQIESICNKYLLRFLPTVLYAGSLDNGLVKAITDFEISFGVKLKSYDIERYYTESGNSFIMAPKSSFKLEERPKDPLLFYKINEEYYYLIHKWGNDLNVGRRLLSVVKGAFSNKYVLFFTQTFLLAAISTFLFMTFPVNRNSNVGTDILGILFCAGSSVFTIVSLIAWGGDPDDYGISSHKYDSKFID